MDWSLKITGWWHSIFQNMLFCFQPFDLLPRAAVSQTKQRNEKGREQILVNVGNICFTGQCWILGKHGNNDPSPVLCCFVTWSSNLYFLCPESPKLAHEYQLHCLALISLSTGASTSPRLWGNAVRSLILTFFSFMTNSHTFSHLFP